MQKQVIWIVRSKLCNPLRFLGAEEIDPENLSSIVAAKKYIARIRKEFDLLLVGNDLAEFYKRDDNSIIADLAGQKPNIDTIDPFYRQYVPALDQLEECINPLGIYTDIVQRHETTACQGWYEEFEPDALCAFQNQTMISWYEEERHKFADWVKFWKQLPVYFQCYLNPWKISRGK